MPRHCNCSNHPTCLRNVGVKHYIQVLMTYNTVDFPTVPAFAKRNQQRFHLVKEFGLSLRLHSYASFLCCDFSADRQSTESPPTTSFWSTGGHEIQLYLGWYLVGCHNHFRLPFQRSTTALPWGTRMWACSCHSPCDWTNAVVYGYPSGPTWPNAPELTSSFLDILTTEVILGGCGPRLVGGDCNTTADGLLIFN